MALKCMVPASLPRQSLQSRLSGCLADVADWMQRERLKMNNSKTETISLVTQSSLVSYGFSSTLILALWLASSEQLRAASMLCQLKSIRWSISPRGSAEINISLFGGQKLKCRRSVLDLPVCHFHWGLKLWNWSKASAVLVTTYWAWPTHVRNPIDAWILLLLILVTRRKNMEAG